MRVDTRKFTQEQRNEFISGWEQAGGYMGDSLADAPWCAPWYSEPHIIDVEGKTPEEWGAAYWRQMRAEVEQELERERLEFESYQEVV